MNAISKEIETHWTAIEPLFSIHNESEYDSAVERLNLLIDQIGQEETHPLYGLLETLGTLIQTYESQHLDIPDSNGVEMLDFFMAEHGLAPSDLPELGTESAVAEILAGKRELTLSQIRALSKRFGISPSTFI